MLFLRSLLYFLGSAIVVTTLVAIQLVLFFLPIKKRYALLSQWSRFCMWWLKITLNVRFEVKGKENIPDSACVIISNHQSTWETLGFQQIFPHQTWVLKKELLRIPVFGWGLALLKPIIIDRGEKLKALKKVIKQGAKRIQEGIFVVIFPEGTRQPYGHIGDYQNGGVAIARKANVPLLPVYHNAGKIWPKGSFVKFPGVISVTIGPAIDPNDGSVTQVSKKIRDWTVEQSDQQSI